MHCDILDSFYLKPNGKVPCEDDIGECVTLGVVEDEKAPWSPTEFFQNENYQKLRAAALANQLPWGETCQQCAHMQPRLWKSKLLKRKIRKLQIEPTMLCALRCPACGNRELLKLSKGSRVLTASLLERVLSGFKREGYSIDYVEWAGQGDPLLHPRFGELSGLLRRYYPKTRQRVITNGNYDFRKAIGDAFVEDIVVSCDGAIQENYVRYRIKGKVQKVFQFMEDAKKYSPATKIIWKYILFEFNDTDEEIRLAQEKALDFRVDEMRFVVTATAYRSERFHIGNCHELPVLHPRLSVRLNPLVSRIDQMGTARNNSKVKRIGKLLQVACSALPSRLILATGFNRVFTTVHEDTRFLVVESWILYLGRKQFHPFQLLVGGNQSSIQNFPLGAQSPTEHLLAKLGIHLYRFRMSSKQTRALKSENLEIRPLNDTRSPSLVSGEFIFTPSLHNSSRKPSPMALQSSN